MAALSVASASVVLSTAVVGCRLATHSSPVPRLARAAPFVPQPAFLGSGALQGGVSAQKVRATASRGRVRWSGAVAGMVEKLNAQQLEEAIQGRDKPLVVDFYATWCGPCLMLATELEKLAEEMQGKVRFVKVDTDEETDLASMLEIRGLPTLVFVGTDKSKPALRTEGLLPRETIREIIDKEL
eukprot:jgi/Mesvir1/15059/Mv14709-RA.1